MSEKTMTFEVDVLPGVTSSQNLGSSTKKWKINGVLPGEAMEKSVDSAVTSNSTNLPTSQAVAIYVSENKDILEYTDYSDFPLTGAAGNIYVDKTTNNMYRWNTTAYVPLGNSASITNNEIDALFT